MSDARPPCPRLTEKERFYRAILEEATERGLPLAQLSVEKNIPTGTLSWWRVEIRRREALRRGRELKGRNSRAEERIDFVPIELVDQHEEEVPSLPAVEGWSFEVALPGGATVRVPHDFEEVALTRAIRAVRAAC